ncbi:MAG: hypothetical protein AVDCRST_MAG96-1714 [uncultured Segetibacter sp.]|uniref:DUF3810 domain-containing protein n=1 Tax=uncultured Segetibacter sp. TaxID=481133 RepID=A0A6J4SCW9_9BACT|nr:MAG: hypothetical protein AVDCRST_MAG96-1714 [uncultured Segetibacter sp.]
MKTSNHLRLPTIIAASCILIIIVFIKVATFYPHWIEKNYSRGIYRNISWLYRTIFGWLPFSAGDILYASAGIFLLLGIVKLFKNLINRRFEKGDLKKTLKKAFFIFSIIYIYFNLSWGLNYNRPGIAEQLQLDTSKQSEQDLKLIADTLLKKVNQYRLMLGNGKIKYKSHSEIFSQAQAAYLESSAEGFSFLAYNTKSVKRSMYGKMGNFLGILGYYNPFTGEAQLNLNMPRFLIPYITCHEIAHQLGYASESEASFVAYLAAIRSPDTMFHYSTYFDLFNYANKELFSKDSIAAKNNYKKLDPLVRSDVEELREYWRKSDNAVEPVIKLFYDRYLKANQQSEGVKSYDDITGWLIAYLKKYGKI